MFNFLFGEVCHFDSIRGMDYLFNEGLMFVNREGGLSFPDEESLLFCANLANYYNYLDFLKREYPGVCEFWEEKDKILDMADRVMIGQDLMMETWVYFKEYRSENGVFLEDEWLDAYYSAKSFPGFTAGNWGDLL